MLQVARSLPLLLVPALAGAAALLQEAPPAETAGPPAENGVLRFRIQDPEGKAIPGRLTFVAADGSAPALFDRHDAAPGRLAVRDDVVYTLSGEGRITVPPGTWRVLATRGLEWSAAEAELAFAAGETTEWTATLVHEVDTSGWIGADFHLHTLTHSGHGDADMQERILSIVGEGVEFAVATDHDHNTDYGPTLEEVGASGELSAVTGDEISTPIGHFNAFPLDPSRPPVDASLTDANELFRLVRAETNAWGVTPVVQVNHPRWRGLDYFGFLGLDPVTATSADPRLSLDFDSIEVMNENGGGGFFDPSTSDVSSGNNVHSVLRDWFHLLNAGYRCAAVGNSDSHTVSASLAGFPRNFVRSSTDDPASIDPGEVAEAVKGKRLFATTGPFVDFDVQGVPMGGDATATERRITVRYRVQAASWIDCDRLEFVINGDVIRSVPIPPERTPVRLEGEQTFRLRDDVWLALLVQGDEPMAPIVRGNSAGPTALPLAVTNPVWVDVDGDGAWTSPRERFQELVRRGTQVQTRLQNDPARMRPSERREWLWAMGINPIEMRVEAAEAVESPDREVQLIGARIAEDVRNDWMQYSLRNALRRTHDDPYLHLALLRALLANEGGFRSGPELAAWFDRYGEVPFRRYAGEILERFPSVVPERIAAVGPYAGAGLGDELGPEADPERSEPPRGPAGEALAWREVAADARGFFDLAPAEGADGEGSASIAELWIRSPSKRRTLLALGSDDGCQAFLNGARLLDAPAARSARPAQDVLALELEAGWNRLLLRVRNEGGPTGLYLRLLDAGLTLAAGPPG